MPHTAIVQKAAVAGAAPGRTSPSAKCPRNVDELLGVIDHFSEMASDLDGRFSAGVEGAHAWMSVIDQGFVMHAYFDHRRITFVLFGPKPIGKEKEYGDPYDGSGLSGELDAGTLKGIIMMLDRGQSPREYVKENAKKCSVVVD